MFLGQSYADTLGGNLPFLFSKIDHFRKLEKIMYNNEMVQFLKSEYIFSKSRSQNYNLILE
jgi:hypothetical protein